MGKIIGIGGGFGGQDALELARYIIRLSGKEYPNVLHIPTAGYDFADGSTISMFARLGCDVDVLYVTHAYMTEELVAKQIRNADVIQVSGGNLKFLMDKWKKSNAVKYLKEAFDEGKVLFGTSSGSMCWFREGYDDCGPEGDFMFVDCLNFIPYVNVPHYEGKNWQTFNSVASTRKESAICIENDAAISFIDGKCELIIAGDSPDARVWFFDAEDGYKRYDLTQHPEIVARL